MTSMEIGQLVWKVTGDNSGLKKSLDDSEKKAKGFSSTIKKIGVTVAAAFAVSKIVNFGKEIVALSSDAEETSNKFGVVFSGVIDKANSMAQVLADSYGMSQTESKKLLSDTGDLLAGFGFTQEKTLELSNSVNQLSADLVSFSNYQGGVSGASQILTKALLGERDALVSLGIKISEEDIKAQLVAEHKDKLTGESLRQAKAEITLAMAYKQSGNAIGDLARSYDSYANVQRRVQNRLIDLKTVLGDDLRPAMRNLGLAFLDASKDGGILFEVFQSVTKAAGKLVNSIALVIRGLDMLKSQSALEDITEQSEKVAFEMKRAAAEAKLLYGGWEGARKAAAGGNKHAKDLLNWMTKLTKEGDVLAKQGESESDILLSKANKMQDIVDELKGEGKKIDDNIKKREDEKKKIDQSAGSIGKAVDKQKEWEDSIKSTVEALNLIGTSATSVLNVVSSIGNVFSALYESRIQDLENQMQKELEAAGVAEQTSVEAAEAALEAAQETGDATEILDAENALKKAQIEEKYQKKISNLKYKAALTDWQFQAGIAAAQIPLATMNAIASGAQAPWFLQPEWMIGMGVLAGAAASAQLAAVMVAKPKQASYATGGIVPGSSYSGDNVIANVNSGEMILNAEQQAQLWETANGGAGSGQTLQINNYIGGIEVGKALYKLSKDGIMLIDKRAVV